MVEYSPIYHLEKILELENSIFRSVSKQFLFILELSTFSKILTTFKIFPGKKNI